MGDDDSGVTCYCYPVVVMVKLQLFLMMMIVVVLHYYYCDFFDSMKTRKKKWRMRRMR